MFPVAVVMTRAVGALYGLASCHSSRILRRGVASGMALFPALVFRSRNSPRLRVELLPDANLTPVEIDIRPGESERLALTETGEDHNGDESLPADPALARRCEQSVDLVD